MTKAYRPTDKIHPAAGTPSEPRYSMSTSWHEPADTAAEIMDRFLTLLSTFKGARRYVTTAIAGKPDKG
jgi:hypothetical protein